VINRLHLSNFKRFEDQSLEIGAITLLSGLNGMGKSSVLQALLLLRQSHKQGLLESTGLALNGDLVQVGTARDALCDNAKEEKLGFTLTFASGNNSIWQFGYVNHDEQGLVPPRESDIMTLVSSNVTPETYLTSLFSDNFQYLQAERIGPRTSFEKSYSEVRQHHQLGVHGEYTAHFLSTFRDLPISNPNLRHPQAKSLSLLSQAEAWLGEICPGTQINILDSKDMDRVSLQYSFGLGSSWYRATNVGFGITYALPLITAILSAKSGALLLLENPEAHLHPRGQACMGSLLAKAAAQNVQIILETHSDHVLNGIRLAVHGGYLEPDVVRLHFFQRSKYQEQTVSEVVSPRMNRRGRIDEWPDGFFDEWDNSLELLLAPTEQ